jgi:hypothetical protein
VNYRRELRRDRDRELRRERERERDRELRLLRRPPATASSAVPVSSTTPAGLAGTSDWVARNIGSLQAFTMSLIVMMNSRHSSVVVLPRHLASPCGEYKVSGPGESDPAASRQAVA